MDKELKKKIKSELFKKDKELAKHLELQEISDKLDKLDQVGSKLDKLDKIDEVISELKKDRKLQFDGLDIKTIKGEKGDDGYTPIKGVDYNDGEDGKTPILGVDFHVPEESDIVKEVLKKIPKPKDGKTPIMGIDFQLPENGKPGKDGSPDKPLDIVNKLNTLESELNYSILKDVPTIKELVAQMKKLPENERLDISDIRNWNQPAKGKQDLRWHGGGGSDLTVKGGSTTILKTKEIDFIGATVTDLGGGVARVTITGGVTSVSNSDGTLTISPTTGAVVASLNLAHTNNWTAQQTFSSFAPIANTGQIILGDGSALTSRVTAPNGSIDILSYDGTGTLTVQAFPGRAILINNHVLLTNEASGAAAIIIRGASGQSVNLQEWQTSVGAVVASVSQTGVFLVGTWQATKIGLAYGGTNADLSATGGTSNYLKQSSSGAAITVGTIPASDIGSGAALSRVNDTNVTLTLGGSPTTALLAATSLTLGWTGTLAPSRGGTGVANNDASTLTISGSFATTITISNTTSVTLPTAGTLATLAGTETFTNKRITKRVTTAADATSITPNTDTADWTQQTNTQAAGTLTINADGGTPTNKQAWGLEIKSTNVQTFAWNAVFVGGTNQLPAASTGGSKIDFYTFVYSTTNSRWIFTGSQTNVT